MSQQSEGWQFGDPRNDYKVKFFHGDHFLLWFAVGDPFVVAEVVVNERPRLRVVGSGEYVTDDIDAFLRIPPVPSVFEDDGDY